MEDKREMSKVRVGSRPGAESGVFRRRRFGTLLRHPRSSAAAASGHGAHTATERSGPSAFVPRGLVNATVNPSSLRIAIEKLGHEHVGRRLLLSWVPDPQTRTSTARFTYPARVAG